MCLTQDKSGRLLRSPGYVLGSQKAANDARSVAASSKYSGVQVSGDSDGYGKLFVPGTNSRTSEMGS